MGADLVDGMMSCFRLYPHFLSVLSHTGHTLSLSIVKLRVARWQGCQPETRRKCYFCFFFLNQDCRADINKHKYFQKAALSGCFFFPLTQRAASYYAVNEQTRTPTTIWSKQLSATTTQRTLKMMAELGDVRTDLKAPAHTSRRLWCFRVPQLSPPYCSSSSPCRHACTHAADSQPQPQETIHLPRAAEPG